ncbi:MAG: RNA polymerase sigma factor [Gemmatimonadota bacterium]
MPSPRDDSVLVARAAQGDESAFRALVLAHEAALARTITAMIGVGDDADDVGQETFVRFFRALDRFRGDAELRTYLTRIAMNLSLDVLARRRRRIGWLRLVGSDADPPLEAPDASEGAGEEEQRVMVRKAVAELDPKHRAVVVLRFLEARSTKETAEILGVPEGTVMSRLKRALGKLKLTLDLEAKS